MKACRTAGTARLASRRILGHCAAVALVKVRTWCVLAIRTIDTTVAPVQGVEALGALMVTTLLPLVGLIPALGAVDADALADGTDGRRTDCILSEQGQLAKTFLRTRGKQTD